MDTTEAITRKIEFDGDNYFNTENDCYLYAMEKALGIKNNNECFSCLEFIAC